MNVIELTPFDLAAAALLVVALGAISWRLGLGFEKSLIVSAIRTTIQLLLVGLVLKSLFANGRLLWVGVIATVMILLAGREVMARQKRPLGGGWAFGIGATSMFVVTVAVTLFALNVVVAPEPWYAPQYSIPLLGMLLGNSMNGIALGVDRLTTDVVNLRAVVEGRLMLGQSWDQAVAPIRRESMRVAMIPIVNAMAAAGVISLPGMMTGQILAGAPPVVAVQYQIAIMFLIAFVTGGGAILAVWMTARRLFDERQRLRLDRLAR